MGGLAIRRVPYEGCLRFIWPLLLGQTVIILAVLSAAILIQGDAILLKNGVHSEAGTLRRVMAHRPGWIMARLTPEN